MGYFKKSDNLIGEKFGRLTVIERVDNYISPSGSQNSKWKCICECGNIKEFMANNLKRGTSRSCGCLQRELLSKARSTHRGFANNERLYNIWLGIKKRCYSPKDSHYERYGLRGISMCDEWKSDYSSFRSWAITNGYDDKLSIDRIDNDKGYSPDNCRWADNSTQQNNRSSCIYITYKDETHTLKEWSKIRDINYQTLYRRYKLKWSVDRMLNYTD